jgi:hypothetical protein
MTKYSIVGQKHRNLDPYLTGTLPGTPVTLVREPENGYDPNAIQVWIDGKMVGYIPKNQNAALATLMDGRPAPSAPPLALDEKLSDEDRAKLQGRRMLSAIFCRSPNSAYPQVEVG